MPENGEQSQGGKRPAIEWIAGGLGLVLTLGMLGFVGWQAVTEPEKMPPQIEVRVTGISGGAKGHVVEVEAINNSPATAAGLVIEGTLSGTGQPEEKSTTTFSYVPGGSKVSGGLFFKTDPAAGDLQVRPLGYEKP